MALQALDQGLPYNFLPNPYKWKCRKQPVNATTKLEFLHFSKTSKGQMEKVAYEDQCGRLRGMEWSRW